MFSSDKIIRIGVTLLLASCALAKDFYVTTQGDDKKPGTGDHFFASLERAREAVLESKSSGPTTVWLHGSWDSVFEFNEILEFCKVLNDMGGIYCYDRMPNMGNQTIRYNYIHSSAEGDGVYFDHDHHAMNIYGNILTIDSRGKHGAGFLYKFRAPNVASGQIIDCVNNIAINCNSGFEFFSPHSARIENNIAVNCATPFKWQPLAGTNAVRTNDWLASGRNISYAADPGFVDLAKRDFRLKPDAKVFKDLPGFQPIPIEKIGLFVDEYRKRLPTDEEAGRVRNGSATKSLGTEIGDRPN